jgi:hypothetical protein
MKKITMVVLLIASLAMAATDGRQLISEEEARYNAQTEYFQIKMQLIAGLDESGKSQLELNLEMWLQNQNNLQSSLLRLTGPADLKGTAVLTVQQSAIQSNQWIYLPDSGLTRRIASSSKSDRFLSSDLTFGDFEPETLDRWDYKLSGEETCDQAKCWLIEATPRNARDIKDYGYSRRKMWLQQNNYFLVKIEYYDREGVLAKVQLNQQVVQSGQYWRANRIVVQNMVAKHLTILTFTDRQFNLKLPADFFTTASFGR